MKIAIIQVVTPNVSVYAKLAFGSTLQYCAERGYDYRMYQVQGKERHPSWYKLEAIKDCHDKYDWVMVLDTDTIINNTTKTIEEIVSKVESNKLLLVCDDKPNGGLINCGVMLFNTKHLLFHHFVEFWLHTSESLGLEHKQFYEQSALKNLLQRDDTVGKYYTNLTQVFSINEFNSHCQSMPEDSFIHHFMARSNEDRVKGMKPYFEKWAKNILK